jgi:hypothetical protein
MSENEAKVIYVCSRHLIIRTEPGNCPHCGSALLECVPGQFGDPNRRPLIDSQGQVRSRAPLWWLRKTVTRLVDLLENE